MNNVKELDRYGKLNINRKKIKIISK
jgi:hypothetical protein